ncbi:MAG: DUF6174 domain-containing protein [Treponema sp.]|nr:DUF6174 domain-containing protein [Treponema sp.]
MRIIFVAIASCILLYGCSLSPPCPKVIFDRAAFDSAKDAWDAEGITSYTFTVFEFHGSPIPSFRATVTEGELSEMDLVAGTDFWSDEQLADFLDDFRTRGTIPSVFDWILSEYEEAIAKLGTMRRGLVLHIDVKYNAEYHFPEKVLFDVSSTEHLLIGTGRSFEIKTFQPQPAP